MVLLPQNKKQTYLYGTLCLKCDHRIWPWPWPWLWILKVKFGICFISVKNGLIATKWKVSIWNELKASITIKFDLDHDLKRLGVRIYLIITGVISDVGMPWTHLVGILWKKRLDRSVIFLLSILCYINTLFCKQPIWQISFLYAIHSQSDINVGTYTKNVTMWVANPIGIQEKNSCQFLCNTHTCITPQR